MAYVRKTKQSIILSFNKFRTTARRLVMTQNPHPGSQAQQLVFPLASSPVCESSFPHSPFHPPVVRVLGGRSSSLASHSWVSEACRFARCSNPHPSHQHALLASTVFTAVGDGVCVW